MSDEAPKPSRPEPADREARLAQALRDNLRRRKVATAPQQKPKPGA